MVSGIIRRLDDLGRIVIPKEMRRALKLQEGAPMEIGVSDGQIILTPYHPVSELPLKLIKQAMSDLSIGGTVLNKLGEPFDGNTGWANFVKKYVDPLYLDGRLYTTESLDDDFMLMPIKDREEADVLGYVIYQGSSDYIFCQVRGIVAMALAEYDN